MSFIFGRRRKRSGSPLPLHRHQQQPQQSPSMGSATHQPNSRSAELAGSTPLHRRGGGSARQSNNSSSMVLPVTVNDPFTSKPRRKPPAGSNNSFLLGGMDKRKRTMRSSPYHYSRHRQKRFRFRITNQLYDLWSRLWYTSPTVAVLVGMGGGYALLFYILIPFGGVAVWGEQRTTTAATARDDERGLAADRHDTAAATAHGQTGTRRRRTIGSGCAKEDSSV